MSHRADREGDIDSSRAELSGRKGRETAGAKVRRGVGRERRWREREKDRENRWSPMDQRGTASASPKNASPGSGLPGAGSVQSSQVSPRKDDILLRGARFAFFAGLPARISLFFSSMLRLFSGFIISASFCDDCLSYARLIFFLSRLRSLGGAQALRYAREIASAS